MFVFYSFYSYLYIPVSVCLYKIPLIILFLDPEYFISQLCPAFLSGNYTELEYETTKKWNFSDDVVFENVDKAADRSYFLVLANP
jgi:hypothetical protein